MLSKIIDRILFKLYFKRCYKRRFKSYGENIRWGKHATKFIIPPNIRISCPDKIIIGDNCKIDEGVYLQCHYQGDGISIGNNCRINAHTHILAHSKIVLDESVLIAPFSLICSGNHGTGTGKPIMENEHLPSGNIVIGKGSWIGQNGKILGGVQLGPQTTVAAGAIVTKSFESKMCTLAGIPAKEV